MNTTACGCMVPLFCYLACMRHFLTTLLLAGFSMMLGAQTTFITNGPADMRPAYTAYIHATVYTGKGSPLTDATIVVKEGKIESVNVKGAVPKGARVVNLKGKIVYPSFIDLYSNYGVTHRTGAEPEKKARGEQFNSSRQGAYAWNEALKPELDAARLFAYQEQGAAVLRACGIGTVLTGNPDGICRGTTALVATSDEAEHFTILATQVSSSFSFSKGSSKQPYPSSLMGSIALIRQSYYDARWYKTQVAEKNVSLEAFASLTGLPAVFDAGNKWNVLRAAEIGREFGARYLIKTSGDEYQRISEIRQAGFPLIVPVDFPKPYKLNDAWDADRISTSDLKHWELAPANLYWLWKNNITFCITSSGCTRADEFLGNLRKAVRHGLPRQAALEALTSVPAKLIGQEARLGRLAPGYIANFVVCSGDIFDDRSCILEHVVRGIPYTVNKEPDLALADSYRSASAYLNTRKSIAVIGMDTFKVNLNRDGASFSFLLDGKTLVHYPATASGIDSSRYPFLVTRISGFARLNGQTEAWELTIDSLPAVPADTDTALTLYPDSLIWFPFNDYGSHARVREEAVLFRNATVWTNEKEGILTETDVLIDKGRIVSVGRNLGCASCRVIDATGKHLTSGIIDEHSHIAISSGVNEGTQAVTSEVRIGDVVNPDDINIYRQLAGGVTASQLLHGSANPIGGQSAMIKLRWGLDASSMKISDAPAFIKFALGENVKQSNWGSGATTRFPQTRMGVEQVYIDAFTRAREYEARLAKNPAARKDLELEALVEILRKRRFITCHSYVQSEINMLMHVADSFGFRVNTFTHVLEGYKIADKLKQHGAAASTFADWWAYKYEVMDAIPFNAAILHRMNITVAINSDDAEMGRRLNQEAAKTIKYGGLSEEDAWKTVTLNPAKMLHLDHVMGSIRSGKDADLVLWSANPLSIYAVPVMTFIDGRCYFSLETDELLRQQVAETRARIISKLLKARKSGAETQLFYSTETPNYHCND